MGGQYFEQEQTSDWACTFCTFLNQPNHNVCGMCDNAKPEVVVQEQLQEEQPQEQPQEQQAQVEVEQVEVEQDQKHDQAREEEEDSNNLLSAMGNLAFTSFSFIAPYANSAANEVVKTVNKVASDINRDLHRELKVEEEDSITLADFSRRAGEIKDQLTKELDVDGDGSVGLSDLKTKTLEFSSLASQELQKGLESVKNIDVAEISSSLASQTATAKEHFAKGTTYLWKNGKRVLSKSEVKRMEEEIGEVKERSDEEKSALENIDLLALFQHLGAAANEGLSDLADSELASSSVATVNASITQAKTCVQAHVDAVLATDISQLGQEVQASISQFEAPTREQTLEILSQAIIVAEKSCVYVKESIPSAVSTLDATKVLLVAKSGEVAAGALASFHDMQDYVRDSVHNQTFDAAALEQGVNNLVQTMQNLFTSNVVDHEDAQEEENEEVQQDRNNEPDAQKEEENQALRAQLKVQQDEISSLKDQIALLTQARQPVVEEAVDEVFENNVVEEAESNLVEDSPSNSDELKDSAEADSPAQAPYEEWEKVDQWEASKWALVPDVYTKQARAIRDLGFTDVELIISCLKKFDGDLEETVSTLLE